MHCDHRRYHRIMQIAQSFADEVLDMSLCLPPTAGQLSKLAKSDLIIIEAFGAALRHHKSAVLTVRQLTTAPIVVFTLDHTLDHTIGGLLAGADAVIPLTTCPEVAVAHCQALLRRWRWARQPAVPEQPN